MPNHDLLDLAFVTCKNAPPLLGGQVAFRWLLDDPTGIGQPWPDTDAIVFHTTGDALTWLERTTDGQPSLAVAGRYIIGVSLAWLRADGTVATVVTGHRDAFVATRDNDRAAVAAGGDADQVFAGADYEHFTLLRTAALRLMLRLAAVRN